MTTTPWQTLRDYAEGRIDHANAGSCPDSIEGPAVRDPECPVCQALEAVAGAAPAAVVGPAIEGLLDDDGENQAVRMLLMVYGQAHMTVPAAWSHMKSAGWPQAPDWVATEKGPLTKGGAQSWLRHLFALEGTAPALEAPAHQCCNSWFLSLPEGRQAVLRGNQWMLADAAYQAGRESRSALEAPAAPAGDEEAAFTKWFQGEQGKPYQGMWEFARAAWMARAATAAAPQAPAAPSGMPHGWVPCILTHDGQHPEEVAYGPQIMMDRLKKWLGRYFELLAQKVLAEPVHAEMLAALQAVGLDVVHVGAGENAISDAARAKVEAVLEKIGAPWPSPVAAPAAPAVDALDAARLDWLEEQAKQSPTGISFDYVRHVEDGQVLEKGWRFMRRHFLGERKGTLRAAIDAAQAKEGGEA